MYLERKSIVAKTGPFKNRKIIYFHLFFEFSALSVVIGIYVIIEKLDFAVFEVNLLLTLIKGQISSVELIFLHDL